MESERKQPRWDNAQSILHEKDRKGEQEQREVEVKNAYGSLRYVKENKEQGTKKEGFILEALEAPGTLTHTYQEKHLKMASMKQIREREERFLYASGVPFKSQAIFYDVREKRRSREFLDCLKQMLKSRGHRTLKDTFGFLCQDTERLLKQNLERERLRKLTLEEFDVINKEIDMLNSRIRKKEAKERQLCDRLQLMIDRKEGKETQREDFTYRRIQKSGKKAVPEGNAQGSEGKEEENQEEKGKK